MPESAPRASVSDSRAADTAASPTHSVDLPAKRPSPAAPLAAGGGPVATIAAAAVANRSAWPRTWIELRGVGIRRWSASLQLAALSALVAAGCAEPVAFMPGHDCELNTNCATPLVCRLGRCRVECRAQRDCEVGLQCVRDEAGLGACQLPTETDCTLNTDCPDPLVCRFGGCTNACEDDVDCPPGARCEQEPGGGRGCRDQAETECDLNSDCPAPYVCAVDGRCREECRKDRDCRDGNVCLVSTTPNVCGRRDAGVVRDAGAPDGAAPPTDAAVDAGGDAAAGLDGGPLDGGPADGGTVSPPDTPTMAAGAGHSCAATGPAALYCWGDNFWGQLGAGDRTDPLDGLTSLAAAGLTDVTIVGAGAQHSCAATSTEVLCWGDNAQGQVGVPGAAVYASPTAVGLPAAPSDLALGAAHTCAIADGALYCWGDNEVGQIGVGDASGTDATAPTEVTGLGDAPAEVSAFSNHTCVRLQDGTVACFGVNSDGQIGQADTATPAYAPVAVAGVSGVVDIQVGSTHTCALRFDGEVLCWGNDGRGQLGDGTMGGSRHTPMAAALPEPALSLTLGSTHSCARAASGVYCWGDNSDGQCGLDYNVPGNFTIETPTLAGGLPAVEEIAAGSFHTCARVSGTDHRCFGNDGEGQLDGTVGTRSFTPVAVPWP